MSLPVDKRGRIIKPAPKKLKVGDLVQIRSRNSLYIPLDEPHYGQGGPLPSIYNDAVGRVIEIPAQTVRTGSLWSCGPGHVTTQWAIQIADPHHEHFGERLEIDSLIFNPLHPLEVLALGYEEPEEAPDAQEEEEEEEQAPPG